MVALPPLGLGEVACELGLHPELRGVTEDPSDRRTVVLHSSPYLATSSRTIRRILSSNGSVVFSAMYSRNAWLISV